VFNVDEERESMFRDVATNVARNTSVMFFQQIITMTSSVLLLIFIPRFLGPVDYGRLYLAASITGMFQILVNYGNNFLIAKNVARAPELAGQILVDSWALRSVLATLSLGAMVAFGAVAGYPAEVQLLLLINGFGLFVWGAYTSLYACFQGREVLRYTSAGAVAEKVTVSVAAIAALMLGARSTQIAIIIVAGNILDVAVLMLLLKRIVPSLPRVNWKGAFSQMHDGLPYFLFGVFGVIYYKIDTVMLSKMSSEEVVGWYGGAYRLFESLNFPYVLTMAVYPVLSRLWKEEANTHRRTTQKSLEAVVLAAIPVTVAGIGLARPLIGLFYGLAQFEPTVILLQALLAGILFLYVDMVLGTAMLSVDKQRHLMMVSLCAIPFNIGLNLILIPMFESSAGNGAIGAAIATGITEIVIMVAVILLLPAGTLKGFRFETAGKSLVAGIGMAAALLLCGSAGIYWIASGFISIGVYASLLLLLRTFEPAELAFLRELLTVRGMRLLHGSGD